MTKNKILKQLHFNLRLPSATRDTQCSSLLLHSFLLSSPIFFGTVVSLYLAGFLLKRRQFPAPFLMSFLVLFSLSEHHYKALLAWNFNRTRICWERQWSELKSCPSHALPALLHQLLHMGEGRCCAMLGYLQIQVTDLYLTLSLTEI